MPSLNAIFFTTFSLILEIEGCLFAIVPIPTLVLHGAFLPAAHLWVLALSSRRCGCGGEWVVTEQPVSASSPKVPLSFRGPSFSLPCILRLSSFFLCLLCFWYTVPEFNNVVVTFWTVKLHLSVRWQGAPGKDGVWQRDHRLSSFLPWRCLSTVGQILPHALLCGWAGSSFR